MSLKDVVVLNRGVSMKIYVLLLAILINISIFAQRGNQFQGVNQNDEYIIAQIFEYPSGIKVDQQPLEASATGLFTVPKIPGEYKMIITFPNGTRADRTFMVQHEGDVVGLYGEKSTEVPIDYLNNAEAHLMTPTSYQTYSDIPPAS